MEEHSAAKIKTVSSPEGRLLHEGCVTDETMGFTIKHE